MVQSSTKAVFSLEDSVSDYSLKQRPIGKCVLGAGGAGGIRPVDKIE